MKSRLSQEEIIPLSLRKHIDEINQMMAPLSKFQSDIARWAKSTSIMEEQLGRSSSIFASMELAAAKAGAALAMPQKLALEFDAIAKAGAALATPQKLALEFDAIAKSGAAFATPPQSAIMSEVLAKLRLNIDQWHNPFLAMQAKSPDAFASLIDLDRKAALALAPLIKMQGDISFAAEQVAAQIKRIENLNQSAIGPHDIDKAFIEASESDRSKYAKEAEAVIGEITKELSLNTSTQLQDIISIILEKTEKPKDSITKMLVKHLVLPLLVLIIWSYIGPFIQTNINNVIRPKPKEIIQNVFKNVNSDSQEFIVQNYKFVIADILLIRKGPARKTGILDKLTYGTLVKVENSRRDWTCIEYVSTNGDTLNGWVFSRYLRSLRF
jgi:hypothetical protein